MVADTDKEIQQEEKVEITIRTCKHQENEYSLDLIIESGHVDLHTYPWPHMKGNHTSVAIFEMTVDKIKALGQAIIEQAIKIEMEVK